MNKIFEAKFFAKVFLICFVLSTLLVGLFNISQNVEAAAQGDGKIFFSVAANTTPQTRDYTLATGNFSTTTSTGQTGATALQSILKASPNRDEMIAGYVNSAGTLQIMCYNGLSWSNEWSLSVGGTGTTRRFDISYETNSGDVMVAYSTNTAAANAVAYRTKSGSLGCGTSNWSAASNMPTTTTLTSGIVHWVNIESDARSSSDLMAIIWADAAQDLGASIWSGTAFGNFPTLAQMEQALEIAAAAQDVESFDITYESLSGDVMITWGSGGANGTNGAYYNVCTGGTSTCTWGARTAMPTFLDDATHLDISSDPLTDRILFASIGNAGADLQRGVWSGAAWTNTANADASCAAPTAGRKFVATGWLNSGANQRGVIVYYDSAATNVGWMTVSGTTWTNQTDWVPTPVFGTQTQYDIDVDPFNKDKLILTIQDANSDIFTKRLTLSGTTFAWLNVDTPQDSTCTGGNGIHCNTGSATYKSADFEFNRYIPARNLTLNAPASMTLNSVGIGGSSQISSTSFPSAITVSDNTTIGWTATATCTNFTGPATIAVTNLTFKPGTLTVNSGSGTGVSAGNNHTFTGTSDLATIMTATSGNGNGSYSVTPILDLIVPAWQTTGSYSATITETVS